MKKAVALLISIIFCFSLLGCNNTSKNEAATITDKSWDTTLNEAKGTTVTFYGWGGSEETNKWIDGYLTQNLKDKYDINLKRVPMNIEDILNKLLGDKQAGSMKGTVDIVWINGENFYTAKKGNLLYGPFVSKLPNFDKYIDTNSNEVKYDFGYSVDGYEAPYGKAQFVMLYNSNKISSTPVDTKELLEFAKNNPGKFTYPAPPDFTGSAFVRNIIYDIAGYDKLKNAKNEEEVRKIIQPAINYLTELKPYLWNNGKSYPSTIAQLDNMYADGELLMSMTYNPNTIPAKIRHGEYPEGTKSFVFQKGTVGNTHFLAIPFNSPNKEGAAVVINEILSFDAQTSKYDPDNWGDLPVFDNNKLSSEEKNKINGISLDDSVLPEDTLMKHRVPELPANLVPIIEKIWLEQIPGER